MMVRRTALSDHSLWSAPVRGLDDGSSLTPITAAVVIGIGGSGIQTVSRVKAAMLAARPDQDAISQVQFLGVDAVNLSRQNPPLPPGVDLGAGEFVNLTSQTFDAASYTRVRLSNDRYLQAWWDPRYLPPTGPIAHGLKRERMLGRLAFQLRAEQLTNRISSAIRRAFALDHGNIGQGGEAPTGGVAPIYIVNSSSGGTGSSGFLEVVFAAWRAARDAGMTPEIRAFTYLPTVFENEVMRTPNGADAARAQQANAYAYFREVDHFCQHGDQLARYMGLDPQHGGPIIEERDLLKQVYVIDGVMRGLGSLNKIADVFEVVAETIFHFLYTDGGIKLATVDATNTDQALSQLDAYGKPRRYCSLGIARVVFPGDTFRHYLQMRYVDWFVSESLLSAPEDLDSLVETSVVLERLADGLRKVEVDAADVHVDEDVQEFLDLAELTMEAMRVKPDPAEAQRSIRRVETLSPRAVRAVRNAVALRNETLIREFEENVEASIFQTGNGLPYAQEVLKRLTRQARRMLSDAESSGTLAESGRVAAEERVGELRVELDRATNRNLHQRVVALFGAAIGVVNTTAEVAEQLGQAIQTWVQSIYDAEIAEGRHELLSMIEGQLETHRLELVRAVERLHEIQSEARLRWEQDELLGKDAGPSATTTLIPGDAQPEVEYSRLAIESFETFLAEHGARALGDDLDQFVQRWSSEHSNRAFFSLGSEEGSEHADAERSLAGAILRDAAERALVTGSAGNRRPRLPRNLLEAEQYAGPGSLDHAIRGLATMSRTVLWSWDLGRFQLANQEYGQQAQGISPSVTTTIARPAALAERVDRIVGDDVPTTTSIDGERVIAMSVEWAVPIHALSQLSGWKAQYDQVARVRELNPQVCPNHVDRRFETELEELTPSYFSVEETAVRVAVALLFGSLLKNEETSKAKPLTEIYDQTVQRPRVPLVEMTSSQEYVGTIISLVDGRLASTGKRYPLGRSFVELMAGVGENLAIRQSIDGIKGLLVSTLGATALIASIDNYMDVRLKVAITANVAQPKEVDALRLIFEALENWKLQLQKMAIMSM